MNIQDVSDAVAREYEAARAAYDDAVDMRDAAQSRVVSALAAYNVAALAWRNVALGSAK